MIVSTGGGGPSLPGLDRPLELLIVVLILAGLVWLGVRFFSD